MYLLYNSDRKQINDLTFLFKLKNNNIDCPELLCLSNFNVPKCKTCVNQNILYFSTKKLNIY